MSPAGNLCTLDTVFRARCLRIFNGIGEEATGGLPVLNTASIFYFDAEINLKNPTFRHRTVKHSSLFIITHSIGFNTQSQSTGLGELILPIQIDNSMAVRISSFSSSNNILLLDTKYIKY
jgi:hypothetical protein